MPFINEIKTTGLMDAVRSVKLGKHEFALFWLGQAGFMIKTSDGHTIAIDPCLSGFCGRMDGFKRLMPPVCDLESFACDTLLISHEHYDHFDEDLIEAMAGQGHFKRIMGPVSIEPLVYKLGIERLYTKLQYGERVDFSSLCMTPVFSDHGPGTPNAMGFLFDFGSQRLYYAGDTAYTPELLQDAFEFRPDIAIMPINGEFGNLDAKGAYTLAREIGCRAMIPCHFWMYARHGSCPLELLQISQAEPGPEVIWMTQGEGWIPAS